MHNLYIFFILKVSRNRDYDNSLVVDKEKAVKTVSNLQQFDCLEVTPYNITL